MVVGPRLAVSLNHLGSHKYWIRDSRTDTQLNVLSTRRGFWGVRLPKSQQGSKRGFPLLRGKTHQKAPPLLSSLKPPPPPPPPCAAAAAARLRRKIVSGQFNEENPFMLISSVLLVQADEGVSFLVVDRIGDIYRNLPRRADVIVTTVGARHKCQQGVLTVSGLQFLNYSIAPQEWDPDPPLRQQLLDEVSAYARFTSMREQCHYGRRFGHVLNRF
ncbi:phosphoenolpyruvate carboxylase 2 [Dorcoceras hygrometricum]|uniref:Phosphoenolpyruvate carboxylase 2 n=1 Tax=Dorcoceras hygrometricum TaxID=472368 RepID=A0A2Z7BH75_9LAMI|nr:phosphoenolpyruvate carboxylase 2 [Dorcoceras hygrometricum]